MRILLIGVGRRMPDWVTAGYQEYARRLSGECRLQLVEIEPALRPKAAAGSAALLARLRDDEGERLLRAIPAGARAVALDLSGRPWSTEQLSAQLADWLAGGRDLALLVGGPDGLAPAVLARCDARWCLSPLTFPHPLVRVIVAEQLYRAWSLLKGHPYHRGGSPC